MESETPVMVNILNFYIYIYLLIYIYKRSLYVNVLKKETVINMKELPK